LLTDPVCETGARGLPLFTHPLSARRGLCDRTTGHRTAVNVSQFTPDRE
jgi:hypothetical protein